MSSVSAPALAVEELVAGYGGVIALDGVSISAGTAAITAVLGANGAGKTTLLRAVSGMIRPRRVTTATSSSTGSSATGTCPPSARRATAGSRCSRRCTTSTTPKAPFDGNVLYGEAVGYTFVQAMLKAGRNPTRADLVTAIQKGMPQGPAVAPYSYSSSDHSWVSPAPTWVLSRMASLCSRGRS